MKNQSEETLMKIQDKEIWIYDSEWQRESAARIKSTGYVPLSELPAIMAFDSSFENRYRELSNRFGNHPCKTMDLSSLNARYSFWDFVFHRLVPGSFPQKLPDEWKPTKVPFPTTYRFNEVTKLYERLKGPERIREGLNAHVKLKDIRGFLNAYEIPSTLLEEVWNAKKRKKWADPKEYPSEVITLISEIKPEIEELYERMKLELENDADTPSGHTNQVVDATLKVYDREHFKHIHKKHLKNLDIELSTTRPHQKRDFIGTLCRLIIHDRLPKYLPSLNRRVPKYGVKELYGCFKKVN